jgi:hypothetical protein
MAAAPTLGVILQRGVASVSLQSSLSVHWTQPNSGLHSGVSGNRLHWPSTLQIEQVPFVQADWVTPSVTHSAPVMHSEQSRLSGSQKGGRALPSPVQSWLPTQPTHV